MGFELAPPSSIYVPHVNCGRADLPMGAIDSTSAVCRFRHPEVRGMLRSRQTPSQLQHSIDKMFSSFSDSPRLSLLHVDVTDRFLTSMNQIRAWRGPPSSLS